MKWQSQTVLATLAATAVVLLSALFAVAQTQTPTTQTSEGFSERYGILTDKNIFVRNRPPTRVGGRSDSGNSGPRRPEELLVLTGIAMQEGRHVAFIENTATRVTQRVLPGESIGSGKIAAVEIDALEFEIGEQRVRVGIGRNLLGNANVQATPATARATTTASGGGATTAPAGISGASGPPADSGDDANLSPEERMRRNRARLLGQ